MGLPISCSVGWVAFLYVNTFFGFRLISFCVFIIKSAQEHPQCISNNPSRIGLILSVSSGQNPNCCSHKTAGHKRKRNSFKSAAMHTLKGPLVINHSIITIWSIRTNTNNCFFCQSCGPAGNTSWNWLTYCLPFFRRQVWHSEQSNVLNDFCQWLNSI